LNFKKLKEQGVVDESPSKFREAAE